MLVVFRDEYIVLNVPGKIVFFCPIHKNVDRWVGGIFRISRIKAAYIVNHYNYFIHLCNMPPNSGKLIENGSLLWPFISNASRIMAVQPEANVAADCGKQFRENVLAQALYYFDVARIAEPLFCF